MLVCTISCWRLTFPVKSAQAFFPRKVPQLLQTVGIRTVIIAALSSQKCVAELCFSQVWKLPKLFRRVSKGAIVAAGALPTSVKYTPGCLVNPKQTEAVPEEHAMLPNALCMLLLLGEPQQSNDKLSCQTYRMAVSFVQTWLAMHCLLLHYGAVKLPNEDILHFLLACEEVDGARRYDMMGGRFGGSSGWRAGEDLSKTTDGLKILPPPSWGL